MANENGEWVAHALKVDDPSRIKTPEELLELIDKIGFLPLFKNGVEGFSVEEHTAAVHWWSDDESVDPWEWRKLIARSEKAAYGKFFGNKAGYVSLEWLPVFCNYRRNGYDFDSRCDEGIARNRSRRIMELFSSRDELLSFEAKQLAGFGKDGEKNFEGIVTELQMQTYLTVKDFRRRLNKKGEPYGWGIAVYSTPEALWGYDAVTAGYSEGPDESFEKIVGRIKSFFPNADEKEIIKLIK